MKKATIITFHCVPNYGAMLQAVAMNKLFKKYFDCVEVLDYRPTSITENYKLLYTKRIKGFISSILNVPTNIVKNKKFKEFMTNNMSLTSKFCHSNEINIQSDVLILGSDQVWNLDVTKGLDEVYYGKIPDAEGKQQILPYAASIGKDVINAKEEQTYRRLLADIPNIGVREKKAQSMLQKLFPDKNISVTLDPTLMLDESEWEKLEKKVKLPQKYVLIFSLNGYDKTFSTAEEIAESRNIPLIEVLGHNIDFLDKRKHKKLATLGPQEFLYVLHHADCVVTDSFHGTAFSIVFRKDLRVIPHKTRGARMIELLRSINAEDRLVIDDAIVTEKMIWNSANAELLEKLRNQSKQFIEHSLIEKLKIYV